jgi:hypothetical protein
MELRFLKENQQLHNMLQAHSHVCVLKAQHSGRWMVAAAVLLLYCVLLSPSPSIMFFTVCDSFAISSSTSNIWLSLLVSFTCRPTEHC